MPKPPKTVAVETVVVAECVVCKHRKEIRAGEVSGIDNRVLESLAALEHEQWCLWAKAVLANERGIGIERRARWTELIDTPYNKLTDDEKASDRMFAKRALEVLGLEAEE